MKSKSSKRVASEKAGPFSAYEFSVIRKDAVVELDGKHFMTVRTGDGARRLAAILNEAVKLADEVGSIGDTVEWSRQRIAHAVAHAMGHQLDYAGMIAA